MDVNVPPCNALSEWYWTVLDGDLQVVVVADVFLRPQRFGRDGADYTTKEEEHAVLHPPQFTSGQCEQFAANGRVAAGDGDQPHREIPRRSGTLRSGLVQQPADVAKFLDLSPAPATNHQVAQHPLPVGVSQSPVDERGMKSRQLGAAGFLHADLAGSRPGCLGSTVREG